MELSSSDKERIQHQYDALAKKTLVGEAKSHRRTLAKRAAREVTFSDLSESELAQLFTTDEYESDYFRFQVSGFDVLVKNELLAEALNALPERKRDIILLSYFLDMSDAEIGELLNVVRTTVFRHRKVCAGEAVVGVPAQIGKAVLLGVGFQNPFLVRYGIALALQFVLMGQSRIKGGNEVLGGLS